MPDSPLDLNLVHCFTIAAEHRHFGRAADALHTTQPSLSRQIARLEKQIGARLFDRTSHGNHLTPAGEVFLPLAQRLLQDASRAATLTRAAQAGRLVVGYPSGILITAIIRSLRHAHPDADVQALHLTPAEPRAALLDRRVDAAVARMPFVADGLDVLPLYEEQRFVVLPLDHPLAGKESVTLEDIAHEPMPAMPDTEPLRRAFWRLEPRPDGSLAPDAPDAGRYEDKFEMVASGEGVLLAGEAQVRSLRPDLTAVALTGVEPVPVVLATRAEDDHPLLPDLRRAAQEHLDLK